MHHVMLDLETMDTTPSAVVVAVGAVFFDPYSSRIGDTFYQVANDWPDQQRRGRSIDGDTVRWWLEQSYDAQQALVKPPSRNSNQTFGILREFTEFLDGVHQDVELWGNGSDFDNVILGGLFKSYGVSKPWSYSRNRCFRTIASQPRPVGFVPPPRTGTHHNALDDALTQVRTLQAIYAATRVRSAA
jgi:hypothetical protein